MKEKNFLLKAVSIFVIALMFVAIVPIKISAKFIDTETEKMEINTVRISYTKVDADSEIYDLPYWLDGTILDGNTRVVITENGLIPEDMTPNDYDCLISYQEMDNICKDARQDYIDQHGIDPYLYNTKSSSSSRSFLYSRVILPLTKPIQYILKQKYFKSISSSATIAQEGFSYDGPRPKYGKIQLKVIFAKDTVHKPLFIDMDKTNTNYGYSRFSTFQVILLTPIYYIGYWDASDVSSKDNMKYLLDDLIEDCAKYISPGAENELIMGWVHYGGNNGIAKCPGFYSVICEDCTSLFEHPKDCVVQHELSHNFNCPEGKTWPWEHARCVMNYFWCYYGTNIWCTSCKNTIYNYMWRQ